MEQMRRSAYTVYPNDPTRSQSWLPGDLPPSVKITTEQDMIKELKDAYPWAVDPVIFKYSYDEILEYIKSLNDKQLAALNTAVEPIINRTSISGCKSWPVPNDPEDYMKEIDQNILKHDYIKYTLRILKKIKDKKASSSSRNWVLGTLIGAIVIALIFMIVYNLN
jgi:hypothetical protein